MEVRIGITHSPRELSFESNVDVAELQKLVGQAISGSEPLVTFTDSKGKHYLVATAAIAYVELGSDAGRRVGFVN